MTLTVTYNLETWFLFATHHLIMMIICANLFFEIPAHMTVIGRTQTGFIEAYAQSLIADCDLDLRPSDIVFVHDTSSCHDNYLYQIIFKSHHA